MWPPDMAYSDVVAGMLSVLNSDVVKGMSLLLFALALARAMIGLVRSAGE